MKFEEIREFSHGRAAFLASAKKRDLLVVLVFGYPGPSSHRLHRLLWRFLDKPIFPVLDILQCLFWSPNLFPLNHPRFYGSSQKEEFSMNLWMEDPLSSSVGNIRYEKMRHNLEYQGLTKCI